MAVASPSVSGLVAMMTSSNSPGGYPLHQGLDLQIVRPHMVHGRQNAVEHMVAAVDTPGSARWPATSRGSATTQMVRRVPLGRGADGAEAPGGEVLAHGTAG